MRRSLLMKRRAVTPPSSAAFCPCVAQVLGAEIASGNKLGQMPHRANWPAPGSVFAALDHDFLNPRKNWPSGLQHATPNDPRFGWREECFCPTHQHLLVAGWPRQDARRD